MAATVTAIALDRDGHTMSWEPYGRRSYTATWIVTVSESDSTPPEVVTSAQAWGGTYPVPALYTSYALLGGSDTASYLKRLDTRRETAEKLSRWIITGQYSRLEPNERTVDDATAPVSRSIRYSMEFEPITELVTKAYNETALPRVQGRDTTGKIGPVVNAAGKEFSEPLFEDSYRTILVIQRNLATVAAVYNLAHVYDRTLNNKEWLGFPKGHAKFIGVDTAGLVNEQGNEYYPVTIRVALGREPFYRELVNQGFQELDDDDKHVELTDADGNAISEDGLLDIQGRKLGANQPANTIKYRTRNFTSYSYLTTLGASLPKVPSFT